jgi:hypothetical protein
MTITIERMNDLLLAGRAYQDAYASLCDLIRSRANAGALRNPDEALVAIQELLFHCVPSSSLTHADKLLLREELHLSHTQADTLRQRRRRAKAQQDASLIEETPWGKRRNGIIPLTEEELALLHQEDK